MKNLKAISYKIAKELIKKQSTLYCYFPEKYQKIAKKILSDYEYIYDPEHKKNPGGGFERTEEGWSKGGEDERKKTNVDNFLRKNPKLKYNFNRLLKRLFESNTDYHKLPKDSKIKIFNTINLSMKKHGGKKISVKDFENIYDKLKEEFVEKSKKTEERKEKTERKVEEQKKKEKIERKDTEEKKELKEIERKVKEQKKKESEEKRKLEEERKKSEEQKRKEEIEKKRQFIVSDTIQKSEKIENNFSVIDSEKDNSSLISSIPTFNDLFNETNEKLKQNGFAEISEEEFSKKFNEIKFPLFESDDPAFTTDDEINEFCSKHICENSMFDDKGGNENSVKIINTIQQIKRDFPNLHRGKIKYVGANILDQLYGDEMLSCAACVFGDGEGIDFRNSVFEKASCIHGEYYHEESGKTFSMGFAAPEYNGSDNYAKNTTIHEMAHLTKCFFNKQNEKTGQKIEQAIEDLYNESIENGDIYKLTFYASTEPEEFWAEIFTIYYNDKDKLPQNILTKLEDIISEMKK